MRKELADKVFPLFRGGLRLRERLDRGEKVNLVQERNQLCSLLRGLPGPPGDGSPFRGLRYALASWLDDLFLLDLSPRAQAAAEEWKGNPVEWEFFRSNDRAEWFWEQERLARQMDLDVLEVFYLCVLLGFRGQMRDHPDQLRQWREQIESELQRRRPTVWPDMPVEGPFVPSYEPLRARERLLRAMMWAFGLLAVLLAFTTFLVLRLLR